MCVVLFVFCVFGGGGLVFLVEAWYVWSYSEFYACFLGDFLDFLEVCFWCGYGGDFGFEFLFGLVDEFEDCGVGVFYFGSADFVVDGFVLGV